MNKLKKLLILLILFICAAAIPLPVSGETHEDNHLEELIAHLEHRIPALMNSYNIPGVAIALIEDGKTAWVKAYGYADLEEGRTMTGDTYCRLQVLRFNY